MRAFITCITTSILEQSRDFNKTVVPITKLQSYGVLQTVKFGTGFCIDPDCRFIGTNYHVAKAMGKPRSLKVAQLSSVG